MMKFALINNTKTEATKGAKGICPNCGSEVIAKCGHLKADHWAHKGIRNCDPWWENETDWHRSWKGNFSDDWQEVVRIDETTGEKHIADVLTSHGLVIEFQHSYIAPIERVKRENFYKNMIWVVDGTRLKTDSDRFFKGITVSRPTKQLNVRTVDFPDECFPKAWIASSVPVIFDFKGTETISDSNDWRNHLYCLYPKSNVIGAVVARVSRQSLINSIITGDLFKQKQQPQKQIATPTTNTNPTLHQRQSQYVLHQGRFVKRRGL